MAALPAAVERLHVPAHVADRVRDDFEQKLADLEAAADEDADDPPDGTAAVRSDWQAYRVLKAALIADKRAAVVRLRDARVIDDIVLRSVEARLDAEEMRLATPADPE